MFLCCLLLVTTQLCTPPCGKHFLIVVAVEMVKFPRKSLKIPGSPVKQQVFPGEHSGCQTKDADQEALPEAASV